MQELTPRYVKLDGEYVEISNFAHLPPRLRPVVTCPQCGEPVIMKLGKIKEHHFAHENFSNCTWTPESILHLHTKLELAKALIGAQTARPTIPCDTCGAFNIAAQNWIGNWDSVKVEFRVGQYIADIALLLGNEVKGVIEILVTHKTTNEKIDYLSSIGVHWIEFEPTQYKPMWVQEESNVTIRSLNTGNFQFETTICPDCIEREKLEQEWRIELEKQRLERIKQEVELRATAPRARLMPSGPESGKQIQFMLMDVYTQQSVGRFLVYAHKYFGKSDFYCQLITQTTKHYAGSLEGSLSQERAIQLLKEFAKEKFGAAEGFIVSVHPFFYINDAWRKAPYQFFLQDGKWEKNMPYWEFYKK